MSCDVERQFKENDQNGSWITLYKKLKKAEDLSVIGCKLSVLEARKPENRNKNRYRDVSPYDHSRITLESDSQNGLGDYINANLIKIEKADRRYILTQGPLEHTGGHFWQMVWEQKTKGIVMLNRIIEKGTVKCYQYWPLSQNFDHEDDDMIFEDVQMMVSLLDEKETPNYIIRTLELKNLVTNEFREVLHFQYTTWPDFGVPSSPLAFLNFLMAVRESDSLDNNYGPCIVHCSAGIGRSGTFSLVDSALVIVEKCRSMDSINVEDLLQDMRYYRMGLIQTPDQLRFSYLSVIEGGKHILSNLPPLEDDPLNPDIPPVPPKRTTSLMPDVANPETSPTKNGCSQEESDQSVTASSAKQSARHLLETNSDTSEEEESKEEATPPPLPPKRPPEHLDNGFDSHYSENTQSVSNDQEGYELRRRKREERKKETLKKIEMMKQKQRECEIMQHRNTYMTPMYIGLALAIGGGLLLYRYYNSGA